MQIKQINTDNQQTPKTHNRPTNFHEFVGQSHIKKILETAVNSALHREEHLGHILLSGPSGYGKTTLAQITAHQSGKKLHIITGYAIAKPADIISILTSMDEHDIIFIDEIHRLKPTIEEMLYIAMEDFAIDMIMPDGGNVRVPLKPFTLIGATTKPDSLATPLKNRFIYNCHFVEYTTEQKHSVVARYLATHDIQRADDVTLEQLGKKVDGVPREIHNFCVKIRDYLITHNEGNLFLDKDNRILCQDWLQIKDGGITPIHQRYLEILASTEHPLGLKTISLQLGINEKTVENEIEPLLIKIGKVQKTSRGRMINE